MEITIRLLLVAMVGLITALLVTFLVSGRATGFGDLMDFQSDRAECKLLQEQGETGSEKWNELNCDELLSDESSGGTGTGDGSPGGGSGPVDEPDTSSEDGEPSPGPGS